MLERRGQVMAPKHSARELGVEGPVPAYMDRKEGKGILSMAPLSRKLSYATSTTIPHRFAAADGAASASSGGSTASRATKPTMPSGTAALTPVRACVGCFYQKPLNACIPPSTDPSIYQMHAPLRFRPRNCASYVAPSSSSPWSTSICPPSLPVHVPLYVCVSLLV